MTDVDERLAEALRNAVPDPPREIDPAAVRSRPQRRDRRLRRFAPALAAAAVVAIAVGLAVSRTGGDSTTTPVGAVPSRLAGVPWRVESINGLPLDRSQALSFRIDRNGKFSQRVPPCLGVVGRLAGTPSELIIQAVRPISGLCPVTPTASDEHYMRVVRRVFSGRVAWSVDGSRLTLRNGGVSIVYTRESEAQPEGPFSVQVVLDRTTAPADGETLNGYLVVTNNTGAPIVVNNACNGWFGVGLSNPQVQDFTPGFTQVACPRAELPVGTTRVPIHVRTAYSACVEPGGSAGGNPPVPNCVGPSHTEPPPLPPGDYVVAIRFANVSRVPSRGEPVHVTLTGH
jgi:hypothetical protein